jgi:spermidine synthase
MRRPPLLAALLLLFVGSGCSALIYEVVWLQLLQLVIGSSAVSLAVLLGTFMGGMCLGSLLLPRVLARRHHPLRAYAAIELGIAVLGVLAYLMVPLLGKMYAAIGGGGPIGMSARGMVAALCLLPPTLLMGATLPAIARWVEGTPEAVARLGLFYAGNIVGAVCGALLAGFYLLRVHDMLVATLVAAAINVTVAGVAAVLARSAPAGGVGDAAPARPARSPGSWAVYVAIGLSGASALGAEVVWMRVLALLLGGTTYTFSIIVAVFLVGLGIGSAAGAALARSTPRPRVAFGICQLGLVVGIAWTAHMLARSLPFWPMVPWLSPSPWLTLQLDLVKTALAILPPALLWGASFPLALAAAASPGQDTARLVGGVYAANTLGAILGATAFSLVVIGEMGTRNAEQLLIALAALAAILALGPPLRAARSAAAPVGLAAGVALAGVLAWRVADIPPSVIGYGRFLPYMTSYGLPEFLYAGEGRNSSIAVSVFPDGKLNFHVSGKVEASTDLEDMRLQRLLGHLPALAHPEPRSVLVVGFGAGVTAGTFLMYPSVERVVIVEIEPLIPRVVGEYFGAANHFVLQNPRVQVVYDDARHYLLTTDETFDVITSDPIHPWMKGSAALYTREYFELVKRRLRPGGVVTQWVPLYESTSDVVRSELATFFEAFPNGSAWTNHAASESDPDTELGYDLVLLGPTGAVPEVGPPISPAALLGRLARPDHELVRLSLWDVELTRPDPSQLIAMYLARGEDLAPWLAGAQINRDRNLRLQYLAGMALDSHREDAIFDSLRVYRR